MRRYSERTRLHALSELNVTPLLDLAFTLLIIFMITTPLIENSIDLVVPTSSTAASPVDPSEVQIVSIDRNDILKLNEREITIEALEEELMVLKAKNERIGVVIRPHKDIPVQRLVNVMDILQRVGITRVGVTTKPEENP